MARISKVCCRAQQTCALYISLLRGYVYVMYVGTYVDDRTAD